MPESRRFLYFFIGFFLSFIFVPFSYAGITVTYDGDLAGLKEIWQYYCDSFNDGPYVQPDWAACPLDGTRWYGGSVITILDDGGLWTRALIKANVIEDDSDGDGVPDSMDECPDTPDGVSVDGVGCPLDSDGDGVPDYEDQCPDTPAGTGVDTDGCPVGQKYFIHSECICTDTGDYIYFAYGKCSQDGVPDGSITVVGNKKMYSAIATAQYVPSLNANCSGGSGCGNDWDDIQSKISAVGSGSDCGTFYDDDDQDGVYNEDDDCPGTPPGASVDRFGCELIDSDEDGVDDDHDLCPGTESGVSVDKYGCPDDDDDDDDDDDPDSDGDGVSDSKDQCPGTPPGVFVGPDGCENPPDPGDGDSDDDAELLGDISDWLKDIASTADGIEKDVEDIESINSKILSAQKSTAGRIQDQVDEQEETNKNLGLIDKNLDTIETAIKNQDSKLSGIESNSGRTADAIEGVIVEDDAKNSTWSGAGGADYNSQNFNTGYTEGVDFDAAPELGTQSWVTNFLNTNPLKTALDASGIETSGSSCVLTIPFGPPLGSHDINICALESGFDVAGGVLYAISILLSLLMIARGF